MTFALSKILFKELQNQKDVVFLRHRQNATSNETKALTKSMNIRIWEIDIKYL